MFKNRKIGNDIYDKVGDLLKKKKKNKLINILISITFIILLSIIVYYLYTTYRNIEIIDEYTVQKTSLSTEYEQTVESVEEKSKNIADVIENVTKSVCGISKLTTAGNSILSTATETELGLGTGIIVSSDGYILSNAHVTGEKYSTCYVTIEDGDTYTGTVVWSDSGLDLSITKINAQNLQYANLGTSSNIKVGESVYAIGNPIGYAFRRTVTSGIISANNRTIKIEEDSKISYMSNLIQTDATINPGNSGGPLIYPNGEVIGINSVKITSAEGIGFAVPIDVVKPVIERFSNSGKFDEANLGIYVYDESVAQYLQLESKFSSGIYVSQIIKNGPAYNSGLQEGDIIKKIDNEKLETINDLKKYIYTKSPGNSVNLEITRKKTTKEIQIILGKK